MKKRKSPPHDDTPYHCPCVACEEFRSRQVHSGDLVLPATANPKLRNPGTVPVWTPGNFKQEGFVTRMETIGITHATVLGAIEPNDTSNGGHYNSVVILCSDGKIRITSKKWLVVV